VKRLSDEPATTSFLIACATGSKNYHVHVTMTKTTYSEAKKGVSLYKRRITHLVQKEILAKYHVDVGDITYDDLIFVARHYSGG